jgi:transposase InsO family protein
VSRKNSLRQMAFFRLRVIKEAERIGSVTDAARLNKVSRQSVHRWIARHDGSLESLMDRSKRPHHHPSEHTDRERRMIIKVSGHNKKLGLVCLWIHLKMNHGYTRTITALYKLLRREGVITPRKGRKRHKPKPYEPILVPGERFQVDVKYVPKLCLAGSLCRKKLYQYTAIDECTRWRYIAIYDELSAWNSVHFVKELQKRFPFEIQCIQTDNGSEFTSRLQGALKPSAFESYLESEGIVHKPIAVATPRHNGKVERSHRTDGERFYKDNKFFSLKYIREQIGIYLRASNHQPLMVHNWRSANHMLRFYQEAV